MSWLSGKSLKNWENLRCHQRASLCRYNRTCWFSLILELEPEQIFLPSFRRFPDQGMKWEAILVTLCSHKGCPVRWPNFFWWQSLCDENGSLCIFWEVRAAD